MECNEQAPYVEICSGRARRAMQQKYMAEIGERFPVPMLQIALLPREIKGLEMLARRLRAPPQRARLGGAAPIRRNVRFA